MTDDYEERYEKARQRVEEIKGFYGHLASYVLVIGFLIVLNVLTNPGFLWALIPAAGWGIGLMFHALDVFNFPGFGSEWEERKIQELMNETEKRKQKNDFFET